MATIRQLEEERGKWSRSPKVDPGKLDKNGQPYRMTATIKLLTEDTFSEPWCGMMISNCADVDGCLRSRTSFV
jgi:hypothetical protein